MQLLTEKGPYLVSTTNANGDAFLVELEKRAIPYMVVAIHDAQYQTFPVKDAQNIVSLNDVGQLAANAFTKIFIFEENIRDFLTIVPIIRSQFRAPIFLVTRHLGYSRSLYKKIGVKIVVYSQNDCLPLFIID
ncbi:hypothetical protein [Camelliibacillus cellulosilyticus]|uniref:hypothetical protein n=1 Tax=Camelliibacillus cellulosilyticus TaxID=2174486 RepID=UPI00366B5479